MARSQPELLAPYLPKLLSLTRRELLPVVKMHLAMTFGHLVVLDGPVEPLLSALFELLADESAYAVSWAITSLCIIARKYPQQHKRILQRLSGLERKDSKAIRARLEKAIRLLTDDALPFPNGWVKSEQLRGLTKKHEFS